MNVAVLIVAAGRGHRFGDPLPKQYVPILGVCALRRGLETFLALDAVGTVQVVIHADDAPLYRDALAGLEDSRLMTPVIGGDTRAGSVNAGLRALEATDPARVLVHDAARPFVSAGVIENVLEALNHAPGAFAAVPVVDALWRSEAGAALSPVARDGLWRAQTPQGFHFETLVQAHKVYHGDAADDVEIVRAMGVEVRIVPGTAANFKITSPQDLTRAEQHLR